MSTTLNRATFLSTLIIFSIVNNIAINAQIIPDNTLGSEESIVNPIHSQRQEIEGGAIRGANLFHSFQEFNIQNGTSVYFANPIGVENILSRITGTNPSHIFGTLGVLGEANLFLINPNGILFGPNARLDLRGSFFASTADSIRLGENGEFSATQPNNNTLLTVNPSALFTNQLQAQSSIINQSTFNGVGLQVQPGKTLGLIGGNVVIDGGILTAEQGQIELGSVGNNSTVQLNSTVNGLILDYTDVSNFQGIELSNHALADVSGNGGGNIQIQGETISLTEGSLIQSNTLGREAGGRLTVNAENLTIQEGSQIRSVILSEGNGTNIDINTANLEVLGSSADQTTVSGIFSDVAVGSSGRGGDITVNTEQLQLFDGGGLGGSVFGMGQGGNTTVNASRIEVAGITSIPASDPQQAVFSQILSGGFPIGINPFQGDSSQEQQASQLLSNQISSRISTVVLPDAMGNGGDVNINTQNLIIREGATVGTGTTGIGNSGDLNIQANQIEVSGSAVNGLQRSGISTSIESLSFFIPGAVGSGNAGNLTIDSDRITLTNGAEISASTFGSGDAGNLLINARDIFASGAVKLGDLVIPTGLRVDVLPGSTGNGGDLTVNTDRLTLRDGGQLSTNMFSTSETSISGNLTVNAREIEATGLSFNSASGFVTNVQNGAAGSAGTLTVNTDRLTLRDGAAISSLIAGTGRGGNVEINARDFVAVGVGIPEATNPIEEQILLFLGDIFPSGVLVTVLPLATGQAGNLTLNADQITLKDSAQVGTGTFSIGNSGDLRVRANEINISGLSANGFPPTSIQAAVLGGLASGNGGNAVIEAQRINLSDGGQIRSGTSGEGNSGDLTVISPDINLMGTSFDGRFPSSILTEVEDFSDVPPGVIGSGDGGNLRIDSERMLVEDGAAITASSFGEGAAGSLAINANSVQLNQGIISAETATGIEGNITLNTQRLRLDNNSRITTNAMAEATGGNIDINTESAIATENSRISANAVQGQGGNIQINTEALFLDNTSAITATSSFGIDGRVEFNNLSNVPQTDIRLSNEIVDVSTLVNQDLCNPTDEEIASGSSFVIQGRGGLPPNPTQPSTVLQGLLEWEPAEPDETEYRLSKSDIGVVIRYAVKQPQQVRLAQGWVRTADGEIILTEVAPMATPQAVQDYLARCYNKR